MLLWDLFLLWHMLDIFLVCGWSSMFSVVWFWWYCRWSCRSWRWTLPPTVLLCFVSFAGSLSHWVRAHCRSVWTDLFMSEWLYARYFWVCDCAGVATGSVKYCRWRCSNVLFSDDGQAGFQSSSVAVFWVSVYSANASNKVMRWGWGWCWNCNHGFWRWSTYRWRRYFGDLF